MLLDQKKNITDRRPSGDWVRFGTSFKFQIFLSCHKITFNGLHVANPYLLITGSLYRFVLKKYFSERSDLFYLNCFLSKLKGLTAWETVHSNAALHYTMGTCGPFVET